eukprot:CAMPEP_0119052920 /NCGR_PEP_ID=MMETSP1177-20130426/74062_1 /TAXON_ID=2985 /ORGANISM="Ochromonas sp, Strain CCMP1899" /LENGTH=229 /DNA_ID=CAMNT_0007032661 /DNA_START=81 /DNA_END=770 /DNA_ORIENTATION=-
MFALTVILGVASTSAFSFGSRSSSSRVTSLKAVTLEPLPYDNKALEPFIGSRTLDIHHGKHHAKYVATTNAMIAGTDMENADVVTILRKAYGTNQGLFNNAAQSWNHAFYWDCMKSNGGGVATGKVATLIDKQFGSYDKFRTEFLNAGLTAFGSGWAWLVWTPSGLKVTKTIGADNPLTEEGAVPLLTMDVWEHAYYLDQANLRNSYADNFVDKLVNWDFVNSNLPATA